MVRGVALVLVGVLAAAALVAAKRGGHKGRGGSRDIATIDRTLRDEYCDQPLFVTFLPRTEENQLLDNLCYTFFPLPDNPNTFQAYESRVFCDGSSDITSYVSTDMELGVFRSANPFCTFDDKTFGYAGCDTYLVYRSTTFGDCSFKPEPYILGVSSQCRSIGLSCLRKVQEIIDDSSFPETEFYVLPMKLPNRCVTQQLCLHEDGPDASPTSTATSNLFYKTLGLAGPINKLLSYPVQRGYP